MQLFNVKSYGATGNGSTNDTTSFNNAHSAALAAGGAVFVPFGTYRLNNWQTAVPVIMDPTAVLKSVASPTDAYGVVEMIADDIWIENGTIDGNGVCRSVYADSQARLKLRNVYIKNSGPSGACVSWHGITDGVIEDCRVEDGNGEFGDAIYLAGCTRCIVQRNKVYDFTRVGICCEAEGATKGKDNQILNNHVEYAHNATGTELNAGIWFEGQNGGRCIGNTLKNLSNTPGSSPPSGIGYALGSASGRWTAEIRDNVIEGTTGRAFYINDPNTVFRISGGRVEGPYGAAVSVGQAKELHIDGVDFGSTSGSGGAAGIILFDLGSDIDIVVLDRLSKASSSYTNTEAADIHVYGGASYLSRLVLRDIYGWSIHMRGAVDKLEIDSCQLNGSGSASYYPIYASSGLRARHSDLVSFTRWIFDAAASYNFEDCTIWGTESLAAAYNGGGVTPRVRFKDCEFKFFGFSVDAQAKWEFHNCLFDEYPLSGAWYGNYSNYADELVMKSCKFIRSSDVTPLRKYNYDPDKVVLHDCERTSSFLHNFSAVTSTVDNPAV
jgi:hypothetical protein